MMNTLSTTLLSLSATAFAVAGSSADVYADGSKSKFASPFIDVTQPQPMTQDDMMKAPKATGKTVEPMAEEVVLVHEDQGQVMAISIVSPVKGNFSINGTAYPYATFIGEKAVVVTKADSALELAIGRVKVHAGANTRFRIERMRRYPQHAALRLRLESGSLRVWPQQSARGARGFRGTIDIHAPQGHTIMSNNTHTVIEAMKGNTSVVAINGGVDIISPRRDAESAKVKTLIMPQEQATIAADGRVALGKQLTESDIYTLRDRYRFKGEQVARDHEGKIVRFESTDGVGP